MAVPSRMRVVRAAAWARNVHGEDSPPPPRETWCWATQPTSKPNSSATTKSSWALR